MFTKAEKFIDKLPFSGKYALEPAMKGYIRSKPGHEKLKFAGVGLLLGAFVLAHANQAELGAMTFVEQVQNYEHKGNPKDLGELLVDGAYTAAMGAVSLRQLSLMRKANQIRRNRHARNDRLQAQAEEIKTSEVEPRQGEVVHDTAESTGDIHSSKFPKRRAGAVVLALAVTGGGQFLMMEAANVASQENSQEVCIPRADHEVDLYAQEGASEGDLMEYRQQWADYCGVNPSDISSIYLQQSQATSEYPALGS